MKNKMLVVILLVFIIFLIAGCGVNNKKMKIDEKSSVEIAKKNILLSLKKDSLTKTGATLILENKSNIVIQYGNSYEIEKKQEDVWHKIDVKLSFTMPSYGLNSNETKEIKLDWKNSYGELSAGQYRIIKSIDIEKEDGTYENFYVSAEFTIK